jgi:hypothetical protein
MNGNKQTSNKVLMGLIVLMFILQTIHSVCIWYTTWLGFIHYRNVPWKAMDALQMNGSANVSLRVVGSMCQLLTTLRLAIADSIMVSTPPLLPGNTTNSL